MDDFSMDFNDYCKDLFHDIDPHVVTPPTSPVTSLDIQASQTPIPLTRTPISNNVPPPFKKYYVIAEQDTRPTKLHIKTVCIYKGRDLFRDNAINIDDFVMFYINRSPKYGVVKSIELDNIAAEAMKTRLEIMPLPFEQIQEPIYHRPPSHRGIVSFVSSKNDRPSCSKNPSTPLKSAQSSVRSKIVRKKANNKCLHPMSMFQVAWQHPSATKNPEHWKLLQDVMQLFAPTILGTDHRDRDITQNHVEKVLEGIKSTFQHQTHDESVFVTPTGTMNNNFDVQLQVPDVGEVVTKKTTSKKMNKNPSSQSSNASRSLPISSNLTNSSHAKVSSQKSIATINSEIHQQNDSYLNGFSKYDPNISYLFIDSLGITKANLTKLVGSKPIKTRVLLINILRIHPKLQLVDWGAENVLRSKVVNDVRAVVVDWLLGNSHILNHSNLVHDTKETLLEAVRNMAKTAKATTTSRQNGSKASRTSTVQNRLKKWCSLFVYN